MSEEKKLPEDKKNPGIEKKVSPVSDLYQDWFLDYASYVILERAVPALEDGLKPVQRRILHAMKETDDGRFNKVANIIGNTMQYHPHGDQSIGDAIVNLGQKDLLIETQGNWGDIVTGDSAAASRYIEARLSKFALDVAFNADTTVWQSSYDGRKKEPVLLPMKFPLVIAQGAEGIAVGLSTKVLPHNFNEIIEAAIKYLKKEEYELYPDFPTAGMVDVSNYNDGKRGGKIRVRSKIEVYGKKSLAIHSVPYGITTGSLIDSIIKANDSGKIKIKQVIDNTAKDVEIIVELPKGVSPDVTLDALYAFTNCEVSISPNACVILNDKPIFVGVHEILNQSVDLTLDLLRQELEIQKGKLNERWHFASLEKIFIEKRIYRKIEECETWEAVIETIDKGLKPYVKNLFREVTRDDIIRLTEIKIKRISKYDSFKADDLIKKIEEELKQVAYHLDHIVDYTINFFLDLQKKYGKGRERKTEIRLFDTITAKQVAAANKKLYVNRKEGFFGFGLKKEELVGECSELDDIITIRKDGIYSVRKVDEKVFAGKNIQHIDIFNKEDERLTYNCIYFDGKSKRAFAKRFNVTSITRDKEYDLTKSTPNSKLLYLTANPLGESEVVTVYLSPNCKARNKVFDFDFSDISIKNRNSIGNILTRYPVRKIVQKKVNTSDVIGIDVWYDSHVGKLNTKETGDYLGNFTPDDNLLAIYDNGTYEIKNFDLAHHFNFETLKHIEKFREDQPLTAVYFHGEYKTYFVKRFLIETTSTGRDFSFLPDVKGSELKLISTGDKTIIKYDWKDDKKNEKGSEVIELSESFDISGWKAVGKKLDSRQITSVKLLDIIIEEESEADINEENNENTDILKDNHDNIEEKTAAPEKESDVASKEDESVKKDSKSNEDNIVKDKIAVKKEEKQLATKEEPEKEIEFEITNLTKKKADTDSSEDADKKEQKVRPRISKAKPRKKKSHPNDDEEQLSLF